MRDAAESFKQLLVETLMLALLGGAGGLLLAGASLSAGARLLADQVPRADEITIDGRVLLFVFAVSLITGVLARVMPALRAGRTDLNSALKEGGRSDGSVVVRVRRVLIVCEVALSLVRLMGAAVMIRSLVALRQVDAGFDPRGVLTMRVSLPETRYGASDTFLSFIAPAVERIRALPGVEGATGRRRPDDGGSAEPDADVAAFQCVVAWLVRRRRTRAGLSGNLQRAVLHRPRAEPRDCRTNGARRAHDRRTPPRRHRGVTPTLIGIAAGTVAALGSATLLSKLVFGVSASDPVTLAGVSGMLAMVALLASLIPAYRAARVNPLEVLRGN